MSSIGLAPTTSTSSRPSTAISSKSSPRNAASTPAYGYTNALGKYATITITGLLPGEAYVFACAAFDNDNTVIHGIGKYSKRRRSSCNYR